MDSETNSDPTTSLEELFYGRKLSKYDVTYATLIWVIDQERQYPHSLLIDHILSALAFSFPHLSLTQRRDVAKSVMKYLVKWRSENG